LTLARLPRGSDTVFDLSPDAAARGDLAGALKIDALRKLRFAGRLVPEGARDWRLEATLGATVVQPCVVSLAPVTTRIDQPVARRYVDGVMLPEDDEAEMPEDDSLEQLPATLDLTAVMAEALALALPLYPRADGAALDQQVFAGPGVAPMTDEEARPLAGLAALRKRLKDDDDPDMDPQDQGA
jgi:uncharacterized metal-binding protein YceD (DUF177 family)